MAQFNSDISVLDLDGREQQRRTIFVNSPLRWVLRTSLSPGQLSRSAGRSCACSTATLQCFGFLSGRRPFWLQVQWRDSLPD